MINPYWCRFDFKEMAMAVLKMACVENKTGIEIAKEFELLSQCEPKNEYLIKIFEASKASMEKNKENASTPKKKKKQRTSGKPVVDQCSTSGKPVVDHSSISITNSIYSSNTVYSVLFQNENFSKIWQKWLDYRKEIKKPLKESSKEETLNDFLKYGPEIAIKSILKSIANGWTGLFPEKEKLEQQQAKPKGQSWL